MAVLTLVVFFISSGVGAVEISISELFSVIGAGLGFEVSPDAYAQEQYAVFWVIRLPRILMCLVIGAILAVTGAAMQGLFRNPLADPSIIGIAGGGAMTAALFIVLLGGVLAQLLPLAGDFAMVVFTFIGALVTALLVFRFSVVRGKADVTTMLLAGIAINALAGAVTGFLTFMADDEQLRDLTFWTLGSMGGATWIKFYITLVLGVVPVFLLMRQYKGLNALSLGESQAKHLGISVGRMKTTIILSVAVSMAVAVALCGIIGFVGLVVPHILRTAAGPNNKYILRASAVGGALLLLLADTLARTVAAPVEIPIGIITAIAGAPVFLALLIRQKMKRAALC